MLAGLGKVCGFVAEEACTYADAAGLVLAELIWPTHCAVCESYGSLLCPDCIRSLPFIDQWRSCPRCGAPFGAGQCTECNGFSLERLGVGELPYDACVSSVFFDEASSRIVRSYKDAGERRLSSYLAYFISCAVPPSWLGGNTVVSFVPATKKAKRTRGFDHCEQIAEECAELLGVSFDGFLGAGRARDQRRLGRFERFENSQCRFTADRSCSGRDVLLIDDVMTTGATIMSASDSLKRAGAESVRCATFARVY